MININPNPVIPALPKIDNKSQVDVRYSLISPYANAHIYWDEKNRELIYDIEEPLINAEEEQILQKLEDAMIELININIVVEKSYHFI